LASLRRSRRPRSQSTDRARLGLSGYGEAAFVHFASVVTQTLDSLGVIPGRPKGEPGILRCNLEIPGSPLMRRPGMTE